MYILSYSYSCKNNNEICLIVFSRFRDQSGIFLSWWQFEVGICFDATFYILIISHKVIPRRSGTGITTINALKLTENMIPSLSSGAIETFL